VSLSESRALSNVHPWLAVRIRWMGEVIEIWGGKQIYLSGFRTSEEQQILFDTQTTRPAAAPGCSQHQYGFAVDVSWLPITRITGTDVVDVSLFFKTPEIMMDLGRHIGLTTVQHDSGHFQVFPGPEFKAAAVAAGFCDPNAGFGAALRTQLRSAQQIIANAKADNRKFATISTGVVFNQFDL